MATTEQKIEKLLEDLGHYILDSKDAFKGDSHIFSLVQAFVDNLKEGDNTKEFDENQLNAYHAFLEAGIPDEWAKAMADRVVDDGWKYADPTCSSHLCNFARWDDTKEGVDFWVDVTGSVLAGGAAAFSKLQCPK